ncbi:hypothetical protein [Pseudomonas aegrilactucae]|uniref:hypothetical protein n=1 Tax=Pseudomonas aegrilactucae TaxID=2854028 RepID=UPI0020D2502F|nr:hypothetical protein [Pseudomonas aegrilactucae]
MSNAEPKSPLTIIAIFAGIIEASALASLPFLGEDSQSIYTWFLVGFPPFLTILFFLTLNFNTKSLYLQDHQEANGGAVEELKGPAHADREVTAAPPADTTPRLPDVRPADLSLGSTIIVSGAHATQLIDHLVRHLITHNSTPGNVVFQNLDTGTQTTLTTGTITAAPQQN